MRYADKEMTESGLRMWVVTLVDDAAVVCGVWPCATEDDAVVTILQVMKDRVENMEDMDPTSEETHNFLDACVEAEAHEQVMPLRTLFEQRTGMHFDVCSSCTWKSSDGIDAMKGAIEDGEPDR